MLTVLGIIVLVVVLGFLISIGGLSLVLDIIFGIIGALLGGGGSGSSGSSRSSGGSGFGGGDSGGGGASSDW